MYTQVIGDATALPGQRRIDSMLYDSRHDRLITGSNVLEVVPLTRAVTAACQLPPTHDLPVTLVCTRSDSHH